MSSQQSPCVIFFIFHVKSLKSLTSLYVSCSNAARQLRQQVYNNPPSGNSPVCCRIRNDSDCTNQQEANNTLINVQIGCLAIVKAAVCAGIGVITSNSVCSGAEDPTGTELLNLSPPGSGDAACGGATVTDTLNNFESTRGGTTGALG